MKKFSRFLTVTLSLLVLLMSFSVTAFAADAPATPDPAVDYGKGTTKVIKVIVPDQASAILYKVNKDGDVKEFTITSTNKNDRRTQLGDPVSVVFNVELPFVIDRWEYDDGMNPIVIGTSDTFMLESFEKPGKPNPTLTLYVKEFVEPVVTEPVVAPIFAVRVSSNLPAGASFAGYGTGFSDGASYNVTLTSYDSVNYSFVGFSGAASGTIAGADVELVANFEEILIEEPIAEEPVVEEPTEEPVIEEPVVEEPVIDEPVIEEPAAEEQEEPVTEEAEDEFLDEEVAEALDDTLPETGGVPASLLTGFGAILTGLGTVLRKRK